MYDPATGYPSVVPYVLYDDLDAASRWLTEVFGLRDVLRYTTPDGRVGHAELELNGSIVMLGVKGGRFGKVSSITLVFVENVDVACARAASAGGVVTQKPEDQPWGLRQAVIADLENQRWEVSQYLHGVSPEMWGAVTAP